MVDAGEELDEHLRASMLAQVGLHDLLSFVHAAHGGLGGAQLVAVIAGARVDIH